MNCRVASKNPSIHVKSDVISSESDSEVVCTSTPLHEAAQTGDAQKVLELLELGLDPCVKDQRGRTPYMLANEKEVRNIFRRFMASNPDKWDWNSAKVPSALTKEMEESQAAKQVFLFFLDLVSVLIVYQCQNIHQEFSFWHIDLINL